MQERRNTMERKHKILTDGEWIRICWKNCREECCDCGLVHTVQHKWKRRGKELHLYLQMSRNERATMLVRKKRVWKG